MGDNYRHQPFSQDIKKHQNNSESAESLTDEMLFHRKPRVNSSYQSNPRKLDMQLSLINQLFGKEKKYESKQQSRVYQPFIQQKKVPDAAQKIPQSTPMKAKLVRNSTMPDLPRGPFEEAKTEISIIEAKRAARHRKPDNKNMTYKNPQKLMMHQSTEKSSLNTLNNQNTYSEEIKNNIPVREQKTNKPATTPKHLGPGQIKYLGLIIEKDDEQITETDNISTCPGTTFDSVSRAQIESFQSPTKRKYIPIRDKYMYIVKQSRKVTIESFEKRSRKDLKRTTDNLSQVAAEIYKQNLNLK